MKIAGSLDASNTMRRVRVRQIATLALLGFALDLTPYVTAADSSMLDP